MDLVATDVAGILITQRLLTKDNSGLKMVEITGHFKGMDKILMSCYTTNPKILFLKVLCWVALIGASTLMGASFCRADSPKECFQSANDWIEWRNATVATISPYHLNYDLNEARFSELKADTVFLETCKNTSGNWFNLHHEESGLLGNLDDYLSSAIAHLKGQNGDLSLQQTTIANNSDASNPDSYGSIGIKKLSYPDWVDSIEFSNALLKPHFQAVLPFIEDLANNTLDESKKIKYARFKGFSFGANTPEERMMVYIPGTPERFLLLKQSEQWHAGDPDEPGTKICAHEPCFADVAMLGTFKRGDQFFHYLRQGDLPSQTPIHDQSLNPGDCFKCHASGPIAIHGPVEAGDQASASFINVRIRFVGGDWDGYNLYSHLGPSYGTDDVKVVANRTDSNLKSWSNGVIHNLDSANRVRDAMSCVDCHDGETRAKLTQYNSQLMQRYVESGLMPPNNALSPDEREGLYRSLIAEYQSSLKSWLTPEKLVIDHLNLQK
jgi:hypothetical protein